MVTYIKYVYYIYIPHIIYHMYIMNLLTLLNSHITLNHYRARDITIPPSLFQNSLHPIDLRLYVEFNNVNKFITYDI